MKRRSALKWIGTSLGVLLASGQSRSASNTRPWKTAVGLNGFASGVGKYQKNYPIWEVLDFAAQAGFDGIELVDGWPSGGYPAADESDRIRALRRLYEGFGLQVFSIQLGADGAFLPDEQTRKAWLELFRNRAQFAKSVGCECIGLWPGGGLRDQSIDEAIQHLGDSFHEVGKIAQDCGLIAAFEIEPPFVFNTEDHMKRIFEKADHPCLKIIYDPSHFDLMNSSTGKPHEMLQRIGVKNIGYLHLTDTDGTLRDGGTSKHLACGDGHVDIDLSLRILRDGGFHGWIMIDSWEIPDPYEACLKGKAAIDRMNQ
ncbi:MAG TPA: sugar phosphate isomerase/epimerase family protein [bacterium]|nr:sugar phosphate isomerase/epimerase family protein [bacterium]HPO08293.1 sugar phosphate isomerase/epimerase family protein [bacterium]HQO33915.1 sugar phosphate isomerase/epimerase family protein [bacterium]HQP99774.1 sugar phosphate isomerase/epimerase family protein [bacterium]